MGGTSNGIAAARRARWDPKTVSGGAASQHQHPTGRNGDRNPRGKVPKGLDITTRDFSTTNNTKLVLGGRAMRQSSTPLAAISKPLWQRLREKPPGRRLHLQADLHLSIDATSTQIKALLQQLVMGKGRNVLLNNTDVLVVAGLQGFDDDCMDVLLTLLKRYQGVWALNMGEKAAVTRGKWQELLEHVRTGHLACIFTDTINTRSLTTTIYRAAAARRRELEKAAELKLLSGDVRGAQLLVPWRRARFWDNKLPGCSDHATGKCHWHPKNGWKNHKIGNKTYELL